MTESEDMRLQRMGLVQLPSESNNEVVGEENFTLRAELYGKLKNSALTDDKAFVGNKTAFETTEYNSDRQCVPCYLPVPVLKINGVIPNKLSRSKTDKYVHVGEVLAWAMEEAAEWCKEYTTFDTVKGRDMMQNMKVASSPETYTVPDYNEHVPVNVINAEEKYKKLYLAENTGSYKDLKLEHIHIGYSMIQCNFPIHRDSEASAHYKKVHLLRNGANELRKREVITVNTGLEFKIEDLTQFESSGPLKQSTILDSIYTHVIARGVFEAGSSRNGANLQKSMAQKFMDSMKLACKGNYYDRFRYSLKNIVKKEVDSNFTCSWEDVESAIYLAVGQENKVKRLHGFNKIKASSFHSKPLEIIIASVDEKINEVWGNSQILYKDKNGRTISVYSFCLIYKYTLILGVVENLGSEFGQVKDVIEQEITSMLENPNTLMEIPDFQKKLVTEFTTRHVILTFRNKEVPKPRQANVSTGEFSEKKQDSENTDPSKEEYMKLKKSAVKDWETAKELAETIKGLTTEENKGLTLFNVPAILTLLKEKNWRICMECMSSNCQLTQHLAKKNKLPAKFIGSCKGKPITLGNIPETIKDIEKKIERSKKNAEQAKKRRKKKEALNTATTKVEPKASNYTNDPDEFFRNNPDLLEDNHYRQNDHNSARLCPIEISKLPELDEETLPNVHEMEKDGKFSCYICGKPKMSKNRYDTHMFQQHSCDLSNPDIEDFAFAKTEFEDQYENYSPEEREKAYWDYDSETNRRYSEDESNVDSGTEEYNDKKPTNRINDKPKHSAGYNSSGNSSSSSSNNSQNGSSKKKKLKKRNLPQKISREDSKNNEKFKDLEDSMKHLASKIDILNNQEKVYEQKICQIEKIVKDLKSTGKGNIEENNKIRSTIQELINMKDDSANENESNRNRIHEACVRLTTWIKAESDAREVFNSDLVAKYNKMELDLIKVREESTKTSSANIQVVREECKKSHFDNTKETNIPETEKFNQKIVMAENQELSINQDNIVNDNPAVKGQDTQSLNNHNYDTPSTSVRKEQYENSELGVNHHSTNTVDGKGTKKANLTELIIKSSFEYCQLVSTEIFNIIFNMMANHLIWGIMFTILFHLSTASATLTSNEGELSTMTNRNLEAIPASGSPFPNDSSIIIYSTATIISQTAIINMSIVEDDILKRINNAWESTTIQKKICKNKPVSCPMAELIIRKDKKTVTEGNRILKTLETTCKNEIEGNDHLQLSNPIIYSTIMGSSASHTMTATAHASALSQAHGMIKTEAPQRSNNIRNVTQSKTGSWPIPEEMTRHSNEALKVHFMPAINSILEQENIKNNDDLEILSKETATVVTILVPTNSTSTHCATRLITTTLLVPIANQESNISVIEESNKLYQKNGNKDKYLLLPHDSVLSKHNLKSNTDTYLVKRLCWADQSIIANSSQSEDPLLQTITITSSSNISISERCPNKNSWSQREWTMAPHTKFTLPITCQLSSKKLNCSAVKITANNKNENAFPGLQSMILEQHWGVQQVQEPSSTYGNLKMHMLCAGGTLLIILAISAGIKILIMVVKTAHYRATERAIITTTPSAPIDPNMTGSHTSPIEIPTRTNSTVQELNQLNSRMEFFAKYKADTINQAINLYNLMGSDLEETTQSILDSYLEETLEMEDIPDGMDLPYDEVNIQ